MTLLVVWAIGTAAALGIAARRSQPAHTPALI
jgi:hypothetical protein